MPVLRRGRSPPPGGGTGEGITLVPMGLRQQALVFDGKTHLYDPAATSQPNDSFLVSSLPERTFTTLLGATMVFNFATGAYRYQVPPDAL